MDAPSASGGLARAVLLAARPPGARLDRAGACVLYGVAALAAGRLAAAGGEAAQAAGDG